MCLVGQPAVEAPPVAGRPPQFSRIVGSYRIEATAAPTQVIVEEPLQLRVRIVGQGPKEYQPQRKYLRIFPDDFANQYYVEDVPDQDRLLTEENAWEFVYRMRPKSTEVKFIPGLKLVYYHPARQKYATSFADAIPLTVQPPAQKVDMPPVKTIVAPPGFLELSSPGEVGFWQIHRVPPWWVLLLGLVLPPLFCFVVGWWWPRRYSRIATMQRSGSMQKVLDSLTKGTGTDDNVPATLTGYLREKLHLSGLEPTPLEVVNRLRRLGATKAVVRDVQGLLETCDRARFQPHANIKADQLRQQAIGILHRLEAETCVRHFG